MRSIGLVVVERGNGLAKPYGDVGRADHASRVVRPAMKARRVARRGLRSERCDGRAILGRCSAPRPSLVRCRGRRDGQCRGRGSPLRRMQGSCAEASIVSARNRQVFWHQMEQTTVQRQHRPARGPQKYRRPPKNRITKPKLSFLPDQVRHIQEASEASYALAISVSVRDSEQIGSRGQGPDFLGARADRTRNRTRPLVRTAHARLCIGGAHEPPKTVGSLLRGRRRGDGLHRGGQGGRGGHRTAAELLIRVHQEGALGFLASLIPGTGRLAHTWAAPEGSDSESRTWTTDVLDFKAKVVCGPECNHGWMERLGADPAGRPIR